jgi:hypothetical protein
MRKTEVVVWLLIFGLLAVVIFENESISSTRNRAAVEPVRLADYRRRACRWRVPCRVFHFRPGGGLRFSATARFKLRRAVKRLTVAVAGREKEILSLKTELAQLKGEPLPGTAESSITSPVKPA